MADREENVDYPLARTAVHMEYLSPMLPPVHLTQLEVCLWT
jgi:hypothetical protein